uniref:Coluporin-9 n=1 Tax=Colubraria reticulata TaxID=604273 RepID=A0A499RQF8_9CAEN|nr:coluporin-9 [Colubraria reticulata]
MLPFPSLKTVLVVFLFVIGHGPRPVRGTETGDVIDGRSLAGKKLSGFWEEYYRVNTVIQVENWSRYALLNPVVRLGDGVITSLPYNILPGQREAFVTRDSYYVATGSYGTVSWEVAGADRMFVLMWCEPYDINLYSNWMGLGLTTKGQMEIPLGFGWFRKMYYGFSDSNITFYRGKFEAGHLDPVAFRDDKEFQIMGVMSPDNRALIKVTFLPAKGDYENLTPELKDLIFEASN